MLAPAAKGVPRWQRTLMWKQVTEAVNAASGHRNRRTMSEVKKKWTQDKRIMSILNPNLDLDQDQDQDLEQDLEQDLKLRVKQEPEPGPTIVHVTTLKSEPQLSGQSDFIRMGLYRVAL
ncbi:hypothetical protein WMY93_031959 [Mugilogobius chulae]|uniref:Myb/SANT-like DNA-binding domain-containing protein n=1 Tax=Mugilogobius chulae TaxID=88201 RepID=A0AAW0MH20_9GOBI